MTPFRSFFLIFLLTALCLTLFGSLPANAAQKEEKNVSFRWAFGAMVGTEDDRRLVPITRKAALKAGDKIKILVKLQKKCFVYLIYYSAENEIHMLFPYEGKQYGTDLKTSKKYYIPQGEMWFELDENAGREVFYLLASAKRLIPLEALVDKYEMADPGKKPGLSKQILTEIRKTKKRHKKFTSTAERPIPIGGNMRGTTQDKEGSSPDIESIAVEVSAANFYYRTFTIDHR